ncbi:MAG: hypothetical protein ACK5WP_09680 [Neisseriaceae bacterium]
MKKYFISILLFISNLSICVAVPVEIVSSVPSTQARLEALTSLQGMIQALSTAQSVQAQVEALKNLRDFQNNPGAAITEANSAVTGLLNNFNQINTTQINNLSQLINTMVTTVTSEGMSLKLATAANMQLSAIQNVLQQIQAQQQAILAYKQAEIVQSQYKQKRTKANNDAMINSMRNY